jgi:membrane protease YdiL (CAAX protease family)
MLALVFQAIIYNPTVSPDKPPYGDENAQMLPVVEAGIGVRFPVFSLADVAMVAGFFLLASFFFAVLALLIAAGMPAYKAKSTIQILGDVRIAVLTQLAAYAVTFWFVYRMIARHYGVPFLEGIRWAWPEMKWPLFLVAGVGLAYAITALQAVVPMPAEVPMDKFLRTATGAWVLALFGSLLAPFAEEIFFRGLLFPALARKSSVTLSVVVTALFFAFLHGSQLGWYWGPLLLLFGVGVALTLVRAWVRSVAASVLVHVSYNVTLFVFLYIGTNGFRNLDKVVH